MKRLRQLSLWVLVTVLVLGLVGCGNNQKQRDMESLYADLNKQINFSNQMSELTSEELPETMNYDPADLVDSIAYIAGDGATADTCIILEAKDRRACKRLVKALSGRKDNLLKSFRDYVPAEISKIEGAVLDSNGKYAVLVISPDNHVAQQIVEKWFK